MNNRISKTLSILIVCVLVFSLCGCGPTDNTDNTNNETNTSIETSGSETTDTTSTTAPDSTKTDESNTTATVLKGRGNSDIGRSEPQYENITGYVASYDDEEYSIEPNWQIPIYQKDKPADSPYICHFCVAAL